MSSSTVMNGSPGADHLAMLEKRHPAATVSAYASSLKAQADLQADLFHMHTRLHSAWEMAKDSRQIRNKIAGLSSDLWWQVVRTHPVAVYDVSWVRTVTQAGAKSPVWKELPDYGRDRE